ncbi:MAG: hypothetical protein GY884_21020 [Proteobacteria bacterium]|nr:hypothetical protein [Pseudomonadota bacterium]
MLLASFLGLQLGCTTCTPGIPNIDTSKPDNETGGDSQHDSEPDDTAPPPPCEQPEVEPNNNGGDATPIVLEKLACGEFTAGLDLDFYTAETTGSGWFEIDVDAGDMGSAANVLLSISNEDEDLKATQQASATSADPRMVVPLPAADTWTLILNEETAQGGESGYDYEFRFSQTKDPVTWDLVEDAGHGSWDAAQELDVGTTLFGTIEDVAERDWYVIHTPADKVDLSIEIVAHREGSPLDARFQIWMAEDGELKETPEASAYTHPTEPGADPALTKSAHDETWYLMVRYQDGGTGPLYWYTLTLEEVSP